MAGSFGVFRQYEKAALAGLAIMAMLAFFVLPPFLQMGAVGGSGGSDPLAVSWTGGGLRESGLQRAVIMRKVMNNFLVDSMMASGQDPSRIRLADDEKDVVDTILLAREADRNGIVVSNEAINGFLKEWTNDLVRPEQFAEIVGRIGGRMGVGQADIFEALRTVLKARRLESLLLGGVGFEGSPPGWRWDYYRRLEQAATVEAVPLVVEQFVDKLPEPTDAALRAFFEKYKDKLPAARSPVPGFRQDHRARYDFLVAKAGTFVDEEKAKVTDEQVKAFYEDRKASLYRVKTDDSTTAAAAPEGTTSEAAPPPQGTAQPQDGQPSGSEATPAAPDSKDGAGSDRGASRVQATPVAFRQPADPAGTEADPAADGKPAADEKPAASGEKSGEKSGEAEGKEEFEPLDKVRDDIVGRLAKEASDRRISAVFDAVRNDVARYGESLALWQVEGEGAGPAPVGPDVKKIAAQQGLEGGTSDLVTANEAFTGGGIGGSFEIAMSREFGVRQQRWIDMIFAANAQTLQAVTSRDIEGNRYLSWKTEDQPEFTPSYQSARDDVLRAWRIVEAGPLASKAAEALAAEVTGGKTLEQVAAARGGLEVTKAGPFTWLTRGTAPFGSAPELSQPEGLAMPGTAVMRAVFDLEPGQAAVAFNEPQTVCYVIRLVAFEPDDARLKELFLASSQDPRRLALVADDDTRGVYDRWVESIKERNAVAWKREPRGPDLQ